MNKTIDEMMTATQFVVEATNDEFMGFWKEYAEEAVDNPVNRYDFRHISMDSARTIGEFGGMPVCIDIFWYRINGVLVAFYYGCSLVVHHGMIRDWVKGHFPCLNSDDGWRYCHCNAANIHHCLSYIKNKK